MQQQEARRCALCCGIAAVKGTQPGERIVQQALVRIKRFGVGIGPVGEQRKLRVDLAAREPVQAELVNQFADGGRARQHGGDHDQNPVLGRDAGGEIKTRQRLDPGGLRNQPVNQCGDGLGGRKHHQQQSHTGLPVDDVERMRRRDERGKRACNPNRRVDRQPPGRPYARSAASAARA